VTQAPEQRIPAMDFLVCPPDALIDRFARHAHTMDPPLVRAVSRHLGRCALCRAEADRLLRGVEGATTRRPWLWALGALASLAFAAAAFLSYETGGRGAGPADVAGLRPDARMAALARFDPPSEALVGGALGAGESLFSPSIHALPPLSSEDRRELAAARATLESGRPGAAARLLEDLSARHPRRGGIRLLLAYALAGAGDYGKAWTHYRIADEQGMGRPACWGLANACLRMGDIACARRELADHLLARRPDDEDALDLLTRITSARGLLPR
jgi:hypothetical protein